MKISVPEKCTIASVESLLSSQFKNANMADSVIFDFSDTKWAGMHPCSLLFSWIIGLLQIGKYVHLSMPRKFGMPMQFYKAWVSHGFHAEALSFGAKGTPIAERPLSEGVALTLINSQNEIDSHSSTLRETFSKVLRLKNSDDDRLNEIFEVAFQELAENAFIHGDGLSPHYVASLATSSGTESSREGFTTVFDSCSAYIEIVIGDLGPGVNARISPYMPNDYCSFLSTQKPLRKEDRILSYAFEPFSTSDEESRKQRIDKLLKSHQVGLEHVASGLYFSLHVAKRTKGQLIIRTPSALLGLDYYKRLGQLHTTTRDDLGVRSLARLWGTHYILRLPLSLEKQVKYTTPKSIVPKRLNARCIDAFSHIDFSDLLTEGVQDALNDVQVAYNSAREIVGIDIILQPKAPLSPRALAVFTAGVQLLHKGKRVIVWCNPRALALYDEKSIEALDKVGTSVVVGDVISNIFLELGTESTETELFFERCGGARLKLKDVYYDNFVEVYRCGIERQIADGLRSHSVLDEDGPFLIEGLYYTDKFYKITSAMKCNTLVQRIAEWVYMHMPEDTKVLVSASATLDPLCSTVVGEFAKRGTSIAYYQFDYPYPSSTIIPKFVRHLGDKTVVVTNVICRGEQLRSLLRSILYSDICKIILMVDSRSNYIKGHFNTGIEKRPWLPLVSVVVDQINPTNDLTTEKKSTSKANYESVKIIDSKTKLPSLLTRVIDPKIKLASLIYKHVKESSSLMSGHLEYNQKHYTAFLDFPRLFYSMKDKIIEWVVSQIDYLIKTRPLRKNDVKAEWGFFIYNPDNSLNFLLRSIRSIDLDKTILEIADKDLFAPPPPRRLHSKCVLILPAIGSGHYARRAIEYVSRFSPDEISMLCLVSRMEHDHVNFINNINTYKGASFHPSYFIDFPVQSFYEREQCPLCCEWRSLQQLEEVCGRYWAEGNPMADFLRTKIVSLAVERIDYDLRMDMKTYTQSNNSLDRVYLQALYESSDVNLASRQKLNSLLVRDRQKIDRFLELCSSEHYNINYSDAELRRRLYKAYPRLQERVTEILTADDLSLPIGKYINAFVLLNPRLLILRAANIITTHIDSLRDIQEICLGLLKLNRLPFLFVDRMGDWRKLSAKNSVYDTIMAAYQVLERTTKTRNNTSDKAIEAFVHLYGRLARSGRLTYSITEYLDSYDSATSRPETLLKKAQNVLAGWLADEFPQLLNAIQISSLYNAFQDNHQAFDDSLSVIEKRIAQLIQSLRLEIPSMDEIDQCVRDIQFHLVRLRGILTGLIVYLPRTKLFNEDFTILSSEADGCPIEVSFRRSFDLPLVICDQDYLAQVYEEIVDNIRRHCLPNSFPVRATFSVYRRFKSAVIEVTDNIASDIDYHSAGGLRIVRHFCSAYGCELDISKFDHEAGLKSIRITFPYVLDLETTTEGNL